MSICFLDIETTGIDVFEDDIIQLGAILVDDKLQVVKQFNSLIKPFTGKRSNIIAKSVHGISEEDLVDSPTESDVLDRFFGDFGTNYFFCGWNLNFDLAFFRKMCHRNNYNELFSKINHRHLDLQSISKFSKLINVFPNHLNSLQDFCNYYHIHRMDNHNALQDAYITMDILKVFLNKYKSKVS